VDRGAEDRGLDGMRNSYAAFLTSDRFQIRWSREREPFHLILSPVFDHLWFLWFLCWFVAIFAVLALLAGRVAIPRFPRWLVISPLRLFWLLPLTMIPQLL